MKLGAPSPFRTTVLRCVVCDDDCGAEPSALAERERRNDFRFPVTFENFGVSLIFRIDGDLGFAGEVYALFDSKRYLFFIVSAGLVPKLSTRESYVLDSSRFFLHFAGEDSVLDPTDSRPGEVWRVLDLAGDL
jgi:hypothetical protein